MPSAEDSGTRSGCSKLIHKDGPVGSVDESVDLRREVERLRAENARLSRLLDLRGQDTAPAPEQLSAPVAALGLVTMASPVADRLALFADRFRARADVYAVRWENSHTGAAGSMPAVAGGWRKGMDRRGATYPALHRGGRGGPPCRRRVHGAVPAAAR
jgi:hypothetical protein